MFWYSSREKHGLRTWFNFGGDGSRRCIGIELGWWHHFCHAAVSVDDDGWNLSLAFPPFFFHLSLEGFRLWQPQCKCVATWDGDREFWLVDQRECRIAIFDWKVWLTPWGKSMEWTSADPWWVRGLTFDVKRAILGKMQYVCETQGAPIHVSIPMPEGDYPATLQRQRQTWKHQRWFAHVRDSFDVKIPKGIPFAGKGENSWDCDDDGLFGMGAEGTIEETIAKVRETVMERRQRYGSPSDQSIQEALAGQ